MHTSAVQTPVHAAALLAALSLSTPSFANDATFGGRGSDLIPLTETRVRMVSEDIVLELVPVRDAWQVLATYVFENPTDQVVRLRVGFPEERCDPNRDCSPNAGQFQDLSTMVRGEPVEATEGQVAPSSAWGDSIGRVYLYDLEFKPHERVTVVHSYSYDRSTGNDWWGTRYLTRTGTLWAGPIGHARFTVRLPSPALYVMYPREFRLSRFVEEARADGAGGRTELVFEASDYRPAHDFEVVFPSFSIEAMGPDGLCMGMDGEMSSEELGPVLHDWSETQLRACRNRLYALHGYPFKDAALRAEHYGAPPALPDWAPADRWAIAARPENPGFQVTLLSAGEQAWINAIAAEEKRRGKR